jgi:site-specific DNA recombinase
MRITDTSKVRSPFVSKTKERRFTDLKRKVRVKLTQAEKLTVGYVRVSSEDQAQHGVSLEAQEARIRAFAVATARSLDEVIVDAGVSAKTLVRPGMARVLEGVGKGTIGTVIVLKLDRMTRSIRDLGDLLEAFKRADAALVSVGESLDTQSAAGRMVINMLGVVSQWEREAIAERTAFALSHKRSQRKVYGHVAFGYRRIGDDLIPDESQQEALQHIVRMHNAGESYRSLGAWLAANGHKPAQGATLWHAASVRKLLLSRMNEENMHRE